MVNESEQRSERRKKKPTKTKKVLISGTTTHTNPEEKTKPLNITTPSINIFISKNKRVNTFLIKGTTILRPK